MGRATSAEAGRVRRTRQARELDGCQIHGGPNRWRTLLPDIDGRWRALRDARVWSQSPDHAWTEDKIWHMVAFVRRFAKASNP